MIGGDCCGRIHRNRIKKRILIVIILFLMFVIGATGWYFWSSYHPYINIQVSEGTAGDN